MALARQLIMKRRFDRRPFEDNWLPIPRSQHINYRVLLLFAKRTSALYRQVSPNVLREVCRFLSFQVVLASPSLTELVVSNVAKKQLWTLSPQGQFEYARDYAAVCIGDDQLFVCGGFGLCGTHHTDLQAAAVVERAQVTPLRDMRRGRSRHAIYFHCSTQSVFVFGGQTLYAELPHCERYTRSRMSWTHLPDMAFARRMFNACGSEGKVFLCGGGSTVVEVLTVATETITKLQTFTTYGNFPYLTVAWGNVLVVFFETCTQKWDLRSGAAQNCGGLLHNYANEAVVEGNSAYYLWGRTLFSVDLDTLSPPETVHLDSYSRGYCISSEKSYSEASVLENTESFRH